MSKVKILIALSVFSVFAFSCSNSGNNPENDSLVNVDSVKTKTETPVTKTDSTKLLVTHLTDTAFVNGNEVVFLRPDSIRYDSYTTRLHTGISEADSDFGFAISMAIDTIIGNKDFKGIKAMISTKRYIQITDCKGGPFTIDRDSVNYGIILTSRGKKIEAEQNVYPGQHYLQVIRKYYGLKK
jgi:hypothetical protein